MKLEESLVYPSEGFFWIIDNKVVGISEEVPTYGYDYRLNGRTHKNTWNLFMNDYLVDGHTVDFDYFPRGRIMIDPNYSLADDKFTDYSCMVFLDRCINNNDCKRLIVDYYNLEISTIPHINWIMLSERAGIDHYTCHNCR